MSRNNGRSRLATRLILGFSLLLVGCRQQMADQPSYRPLDGNQESGDGQSARLPIPDTVSRGDPAAGDPFYIGQADGKPLVKLPITVTMEVLKRGQERFNIFCSPCHDRAGTGNGMIVQRGFARPPSFHSDTLRALTVGQIFDVVTHGFSAMPAYGNLIPASDRWAIIAYVRALQLSQDAPLSAVPSSISPPLGAP